MWRMPCVSVEIWGRLYGVTVKVALHGGLPQGQAAICSYLLPVWLLLLAYCCLAAAFSAAACTAVMATVLTMSGTVQPRERSLTGLLRP